jgi:predicted transcriptional regulator
MDTQTEFIGTTEAEFNASEVQRHERYRRTVTQALDHNQRLTEPASTKLVLLTLASCNHAHRTAAPAVTLHSGIPEITVIRALRRLVQLGLVKRHVEHIGTGEPLVSYEIVMPPETTETLEDLLRA